MINRRAFGWIVAAVFVLPSCAPIMYTNVGQNVPLFRQKGEVALSGGNASVQGETYWLGAESADGFYTQAAVATGKHTAVISSYYEICSDEANSDGSGKYFEFGIGRFSYSQKTKLTAEIFLGTGFGSIRNVYDGARIDLKYVKPFIQPSVGFSSRFIDLAFTSRIAFVSYTSNSVSFSDVSQQYAFHKFWEEKRNSMVFEPGFTIRAGFKLVKLQIQYSHTSFNYDWSSESEKHSAVYNDYFSAGIFVLISNRWKRKKDS
jgi:hypothetical protein